MENARLEKVEPDYRIGNRDTGKCGTSLPGVENAEQNCIIRRKFKNDRVA